MSDKHLYTPAGTRVKLAIKDYCAAHGCTYKVDSKGASKREQAKIPNLTYILYADSCKVIFQGYGKGNSNWEVLVFIDSDKKILTFDGVDDMAKNLPSRIYNQATMIGKKAHKLSKILREVCLLLDEHKFVKGKVQSKGYDEVLWRRAKGDMRTCLLGSDSLYQEFTSMFAQQILEGLELSPTEENMLSCLRAAQLSIKAMCEL